MSHRQQHEAGLFGGGLTHTTEDGWFLEEEAQAWPTRSILLTAPDTDECETRTNAVVVGDSGACELRAFGSSQTGRSFVIATNCALEIFTRMV